MMLRKITNGILLIFTIATFGLAGGGTAAAATYVSVKGDNVNVRTGPGTNYDVAMELFDGYPLEVVSTQGDWLKVVDFENDSGWIHSSLVENGTTVIVNGNESVNMRSGPSTNDAVVAQVERGVVMTRLETQGKWEKLKHASGLVGWIYKPLLWP